MSLEVARAVYDRFAAQDIEGFLALCANDIEWVVNGPASLEKCRTYRGIDGVREFLSVLDRTWRFTSFRPHEFIACGERVVVLGEEKGMDQSSNAEFENRWVHVFTIRNRVVVLFREFLCHWSGTQRPPPMSWGTDAT